MTKTNTLDEKIDEALDLYAMWYHENQESGRDLDRYWDKAEAREQINTLLQEAEARGALKQLKIVIQHPEDGCVWGVKEVGKRAIEAYEFLQANTKESK